MGYTLITLLLSYITTNLGYLSPPSSIWSCSGVTCRPGRQCVSTRPGLAECKCIETCPAHWKPVCGSDGISYDSHCQLHKAACQKEKPISPLHSGFCSGEREALIGRQEFLQQLSLWDQELNIPLPDACFQNDRDRLREFILNWFQISANKHQWYSPGMTSGEELLGHFTSMDNQKGHEFSDSFLDSREWLFYLNRNKVKNVTSRADRMRQLCLDALVEEGDTDFDWRLSFPEFRRLLSSTYQPSRALCHLNGEKFEDGAETPVECNGCVCACGKWVCTSLKCPKVSRSNVHEDNEDDNPEDDPHVENIRWF